MSRSLVRIRLEAQMKCFSSSVGLEHLATNEEAVGSLHAKRPKVERESYLKYDNVRMPEWSKGAVCKTVFRRFKSDSSLNSKRLRFPKSMEMEPLCYAKLRMAFKRFLTFTSTLHISLFLSWLSSFPSKSTALFSSRKSSSLSGMSVIESCGSAYL